ncbi:MAG: DUF2071 domain-containing protein [Acidobacteriota bacterium]|nr:DUF2071 domain-containing protein [Acidobacteriota bacterium]
MGALMTSPLSVRGCLRDARLFNFSVDPKTVRHLVPKPLQPVIYRDRAWISTVSVQLDHMRPAFLPIRRGLHYHHIAYRLLVNCPAGKGLSRGVFFLESFCPNLLYVALGNLFTEYAFTHAGIEMSRRDDDFQLACRDQEYEIHAAWRDAPGDLPRTSSLGSVQEGIDLIGPLQRAFHVAKNGRVSSVAVSREKWPLQPIQCTDFRTSRFPEAKLEIALRVTEPIDYTWNRAGRVA